MLGNQLQINHRGTLWDKLSTGSGFSLLSGDVCNSTSNFVGRSIDGGLCLKFEGSFFRGSTVLSSLLIINPTHTQKSFNYLHLSEGYSRLLVHRLPHQSHRQTVRVCVCVWSEWRVCRVSIVHFNIRMMLNDDTK